MGYKDYELLTQKIFQGISRLEGLSNSKVEHDVVLTGLSGATHQIDVVWDYEMAGMSWRVLIQAKDWKNPVDFPTINAFNSVLGDLGRPRGIMVTRTGYDKGNIEKLASAYNIQLFVVDEYGNLAEGNAPSISIEATTLDVALEKFTLHFAQKPDCSKLDDYLSGPKSNEVLIEDEDGKTMTFREFRNQLQSQIVGGGFKDGNLVDANMDEPYFLRLPDCDLLQITKVSCVLRLTETGRYESNMFVTHLMRLATGDPKFYVDNNFNVHHVKEVRHGLELPPDVVGAKPFEVVMTEE